MISVLISTHDDERNLAGCIDSVAWSDDIHVLGSAESAALRHPWVFLLEADERPSPGLAAEMREAVALATPEVLGFRMPREDRLWGSRLPSGLLTTFPVRLWRTGSLPADQQPAANTLNSSSVRDLQSPLLHLALARGIGAWVTERNRISSAEAALLAQGDPARSAALLPLRPLAHWFSAMFVRRAFLDGRAGFLDATAQSFYEYVISLKLREIRRQQKGQPF